MLKGDSISFDKKILLSSRVILQLLRQIYFLAFTSDSSFSILRNSSAF